MIMNIKARWLGYLESKIRRKFMDRDIATLIVYLMVVNKRFPSQSVFTILVSIGDINIRSSMYKVFNTIEACSTSYTIWGGMETRFTNIIGRLRSDPINKEMVEDARSMYMLDHDLIFKMVHTCEYDVHGVLPTLEYDQYAGYSDIIDICREYII